VNDQLRDLLNQIETSEFIARVGVVSTLEAFESAIGRDPWVSQLLGQVSDQAAANELEKRLIELLSTITPAGWSNPRDIPIAVYLRTLDILRPLRAMTLSRRTSAVDGLWWARKLATRIRGSGDASLTVSFHAKPGTIVGIPRGVTVTHHGTGARLGAVGATVHNFRTAVRATDSTSGFNNYVTRPDGIVVSAKGRSA
jgi:hypothetical protein